MNVRLDYLWKLQAQKELNDMEELQDNNKHLILNILPEHVAKYYLLVERNHEVSRHIDVLHSPSPLTLEEVGVFFTKTLV